MWDYPAGRERELIFIVERKCLASLLCRKRRHQLDKTAAKWCAVVMCIGRSVRAGWCMSVFAKFDLFVAGWRWRERLSAECQREKMFP